MGTWIVDSDARILVLHNIVFRCIPAVLRVVLTTKIKVKFGVTFSGQWLLNNEHRVVPKLARFQQEMMQYNNVSRWDASLLCKILLYSSLYLLAVQVPSSNYIILNPNELLVTEGIGNLTLGQTAGCFSERHHQKMIIHKRSGSTRFVTIRHSTVFTESGTFLLTFSDPILNRSIRKEDNIYICSEEWSAVREMGDIRNQHAHRPSEKVTTDELKQVVNKMSTALKSLNIQPCQHTNRCICSDVWSNTPIHTNA